jgi:hypothetical protein
MKAFALVAVIACLVSCAGIEWTTEDTAGQMARLAVMAADWSQTRYISAHPDKFYEKNWALGRHPSDGSVNTYFALYGLVDTLVAIALPGTITSSDGVVFHPRRYWQAIGFMVEGSIVGKNAGIGIGMKW